MLRILAHVIREIRGNPGDAAPRKPMATPTPNPDSTGRQPPMSEQMWTDVPGRQHLKPASAAYGNRLTKPRPVDSAIAHVAGVARTAITVAELRAEHSAVIRRMALLNFLAVCALTLAILANLVSGMITRSKHADMIEALTARIQKLEPVEAPPKTEQTVHLEPR